MKLICLGLLLAFRLVSSKPGNAPTMVPAFALVGDRLDNGQPPQVSITFPNGHTDNLILDRFHPEKDNIAGYFGHLENEPKACVALTGRIGLEDVEFTINSRHASGSNMYKWKKDGTVEVIKYPIRFKDDADETMRRLNMRRGTDDEVVNKKLKKKEFQIAYHLKRNSPKPPANQRLKINMVKSRAFSKRHGGTAYANGFLLRAQVHLQAAYCYPTLGWKIRIDAKSGYTLRSSEEITNLRANRRGLESLKPVNEKYLRRGGGAELVAYCVDGNPTTGVAYTSVACDPNSKLKYSINEYSESAAEFGATLAHEIGHNLGMYHDFDIAWGGKDTSGNEKGNHGTNGYPNGKSPHYCETDQSIMSYGQSSFLWSVCSKENFQAHYIKFQKDWCLDDLKTTDPCARAKKPVCEDTKEKDTSRHKNHTCEDLAAPHNNWCFTNPSFMSWYCRKTCKNLFTNRQRDSTCNKYQSWGYCSKHFNWMRHNCKKACWIC